MKLLNQSNPYLLFHPKIQTPWTSSVRTWLTSNALWQCKLLYIIHIHACKVRNLDRAPLSLYYETNCVKYNQLCQVVKYTVYLGTCESCNLRSRNPRSESCNLPSRNPRVVQFKVNFRPMLVQEANNIEMKQWSNLAQ